MFGVNNKDLQFQLTLLQENVNETNRRLQEMKIMLLEIQKSTLGNRAAIIKDRNPTREIIKEVTVTRARKKPRERIAKTAGGKRITEAEIDEMMVLFDRGLSYTEISGMTGRSASSISNKVYKRKQEAGEL